MNTAITQSEHRRKIAISLFSGAGGLDLGFHYLDYFIPVAIEIDKQAAYTYAQNFGCKIINTGTDLNDIHPEEPVIINDDIRKVTGKFILDLCERIVGTKKIDTILGGPSCQSWSIAGKQLGILDVRGQMIYEYLRLLQELNPASFLFENVKGIISKKSLPIFKDLITKFEELGYNINYKLINSWDYGIAQTRERVIVVGIRTDFNVMYEFPATLPFKLVLKDVISDLPTPRVYIKNAPENEAYKVPNKILGFKGVNHYNEWITLSRFESSLAFNDKELGLLMIKHGVHYINQDETEVANHSYFDNINKNITYNVANRPIDINKPSPTITAHSRCCHVLMPNHQVKDFGFSSRYISRDRQRQWDEAGFTVVGDGRQQALYPEPPNFDIRNHDFRAYSKEKQEFLSQIPEGGDWRDLSEDKAKQYMGNAINSGGGKTGFLRKLSSEKPSPTILASMEQKFAEFCVPTEVPRRLTVRECMRIQSFPDWFILYGSLSAQYRQVGNAVPVILAFHLGKQLVNMMHL